MSEQTEPRYESDSDRKKRVNEMARLFMIRNNEDMGFSPLSQSESEEVDAFLKTASAEEIDEVERSAGMKAKFFQYVDKSLPESERLKIEKEMEEDEELCEYIEGELAEVLAEEYAMWRHEVSNGQGSINCEMSDEHIRMFFDLLDRYPQRIEDSLSFMTSEISLHPDDNQKMIISPNEESFLSERQKLLELRDYLTGDLDLDKKGEFSNELIDDIRFRSLFLKVKKALAK